MLQELGVWGAKRRHAVGALANIYTVPATVARVMFEAGLSRGNGTARMFYHPLGRIVFSSAIWLALVLVIVNAT